jgi:nucleoside-diphosphate-sugar epimerase
MNRQILVTGGGGYIGSVLVRALLERGYKVTVLDRLYWGKGPLASVLDQISLICDDVRTFDPTILRDVDGVIHLAGLSNDPTAEYNPAANWEMNAVATQRLAAACRDYGVERLTYGASCSAYDGLPSDQVHDETAAIKPWGAYATSKVAGEQALIEAADSGFCPVILRQGTVYGFSPRMRYDLVVNTFVKDALLRSRLMLHGGGWMWRPLVDVSDVAEAHIRCLEAPADLVRGQIFNVVHGNYQIRELAMLVAGSVQLLQREVKIEQAPLPSLVRDYRCSNAKLTQTLDFTPRVSVLESIDRMLGQIKLDGYMDFGNPRYYNIAWMTLLCDVSEQLTRFQTVF